MTEQNQSGTPPADSKRYLPVWGPWQTAGLGIAILLINGAAQAGVIVTIAAREFIFNLGLDISQAITGLTSNGLLVSLSTIVGSAVGVVMVIVFVKARRRAPVREYLALKRLTKKQSLISLGIVAGLIAILELISSATGQTPDTGFNLEIYRTSDPLALLWIAFVIFGPAFEEVFFRGFLFAGWLKSRIGPVGTIALTSALWAALHVQYDVYGMAQILIIGIALGIMRYKTKSLWSPLLMHFAWNLTGMIAIDLSLRGFGS